MQALSTLKQGDSSASAFLGLLDRYEGVLRRTGKVVYRAAPADGQRMFQALSEGHRKRLIARIANELEIFDEILAGGEQITDSPRLLWRYLLTANYVPCPDIFSKITDGDIVEVYGAEQTHLFQNLNFFDWVSMTLEQIYCETWYQNSARDPEIQQGLAKVAIGILTGEIAGTVDPGLPWHVLREHGQDRLEFDFCVKWMSPFRFDGRVAGVITVCTAHSKRSLLGKDAPHG